VTDFVGILKGSLKAELQNIKAWIMNLITRKWGYKQKEQLYE
jgi:hypothetical protein